MPKSIIKFPYNTMKQVGVSRCAPTVFHWREGDWHWGYMQLCVDFKNYITKIMSWV